jgi:hypothetical protein
MQVDDLCYPNNVLVFGSGLGKNIGMEQEVQNVLGSKVVCSNQ